MKPYHILLLIIVSSVVTFLIGASFWWSISPNAVDPESQTVQTFVVTKGASTATIGQALAKDRLIKSALRFRLLVRQQGWGAQLKPGKYLLSQSMTTQEIAQKIKEGVVDDFWVVIPEGKRREEIAAIFLQAYQEHQLKFDTQQFLALTKDKEGYLFPETYMIPKSWSEEQVVTLLTDTFNKNLGQNAEQAAAQHQRTLDEVIILASMVEREAKFDQDRAKVAGVLHNRLDIGMALQIDATVQYAVGSARCGDQVGQDCNWWPVISSTEFESPYNTYQNPGLPPAPIANPGLAAIQAVLEPAEHDYLYYLSQDDGTTHYSKTIEEHNQKIDLYLR